MIQASTSLPSAETAVKRSGGDELAAGGEGVADGA